jgi:glycosyltransferase involved in cell wall biosynthesis
MQAALAQQLSLAPRPAILRIPSAIPEERRSALDTVCPAFEADHLVFIANGPSGWRLRYKGLDLVLQTFERVLGLRPEATLTVVGEWSHEARCAALTGMSAGHDRVRFVGRSEGISQALSSASLCLQLGRGDAFAISALEAMYARVPTIVSEWTGAKEVVARVEPRYIVPLDPQLAARTVDAHLALPALRKRELGERFRAAAASYTAEAATLAFRRAVSSVIVGGNDVERRGIR